MKRRMGAAVTLVLVIFIFIYLSPISGNKIISYIQMDTVSKVTVQKTLENGMRTDDLGTVEISSTELEQFYKALGNAQVRDIGENSFAIHTDVRYYVFLENHDGCIVGRMKFYGNEILIFDYSYSDRPAVYKRYSIISSAFQDFFESIFLPETKEAVFS